MKRLSQKLGQLDWSTFTEVAIEQIAAGERRAKRTKVVQQVRRLTDEFQDSEVTSKQHVTLCCNLKTSIKLFHYSFVFHLSVGTFYIDIVD